MFWQLRLIPAWLLVAAALMLAACGGGSSKDGDSAADINSNEEPEAFVLNGTEALDRSAQSFTDEVESVSGQFEYSFEIDGMSVAGDADFAFEAPDRMHMTMSFDGGDETGVIDLGELGDMEILSRDGTIYMNVPLFGGWVSLSPEEFGVDADSLEELASQSSMFDYAGLLADLGDDVEYLGDEQVNGHDTHHYHFSGNVADILDSFASALANSGETTDLGSLGNDVTGLVDVDVWVGSDDQLPYMMLFGANLNGGDFIMSMTGTFDDYNDDVDIPDAPDDAKSFEELFGDLGDAFGETED